MGTVISTPPPKNTPRWLTLAYWGVTGLFCLVMLAGGIGDVIAAAPVVEGVVRLGYPPYVTLILGIGKLLGVPALLYPGFYRLKEWAYAGYTFNLLGAVASHLLAGDSFLMALLPLVLWVLMVASYGLYYLHGQK